MMSRLSLIPLHSDDDDDDVLKLHDGVSTETREITIVASPLRPAGQGTPAAVPPRSPQVPVLAWMSCLGAGACGAPMTTPLRFPERP